MATLVTTNCPKVFIVSKGFHDVSPAGKFGELILLSEEPMNRFATSSIARKFMNILKDSSKEDYILLSGLTVMSVIACSIFVTLHGRINLLLFRQDSPEEPGEYVPRTLVFDSLNCVQDGEEY